MDRREGAAEAAAANPNLFRAETCGSISALLALRSSV